MAQLWQIYKPVGVTPIKAVVVRAGIIKVYTQLVFISNLKTWKGKVNKYSPCQVGGEIGFQQS